MGGAGLAPTGRGACGREGPAAGVRGPGGVGGMGGARIRWSGDDQGREQWPESRNRGRRGWRRGGPGLPERARNPQLSVGDDVTEPRCVWGAGRG